MAITIIEKFLLALALLGIIYEDKLVALEEKHLKQLRGKLSGMSFSSAFSVFCLL